MAVKTSWSSGDVLTAADLTDTFAAKGDVSGETWTGTHDFTGATVTGAGSLSVITAQTFSAASTVSVNNCFTASYDNYVVIITGTASANTQLVMRYRASGSDEATTVYSRGMLYTSSGGTGFEQGSASSTVAMLGGIYTTGRMNITANVFAPNLASTESNLHFQSVANTYFAGWSRCSSTTQFDGFTIFPNSGNITGTVRVYGLQNS